MHENQLVAENNRSDKSIYDIAMERFREVQHALQLLELEKDELIGREREFVRQLQAWSIILESERPGSVAAETSVMGRPAHPAGAQSAARRDRAWVEDEHGANGAGAGGDRGSDAEGDLGAHGEGGGAYQLELCE